MDVLVRFEAYCKEKQLFTKQHKLLLAVSGGVDSVVLCELCKQAGFQFQIAHCNFQLRQEESVRDELFVKKLGEKYQVTVFSKKFDTEKFAVDHKISIQEAARFLRYTWFEELTQESGAYLLTAHHADDSVETVLMNLFRGTGLHGMTGIPVKNKNIRRPLLWMTKEEIRLFVASNLLSYVEDSSNQSSKYTRNYFRNELIPAIRTIYPQATGNVLDTIERFKEIEKIYLLAINDWKNKLYKRKGTEIHIPIKQLLQIDNKALIFEIISEFGFTEKQIDELLKLSNSDSGRYIESPDSHFRIIKHRHWFIISPMASTEVSTIAINEGQQKIRFEAGVLDFEKITKVNLQLKETTIAQVDAKELKFPMLLRKYKTGDYFYPLGMRKKKKLSRFFIDQKFSKTEKENCWVLESNGKIIWIVGHRIDDRFKVSESTKNIIRITLHA